MSSDPIESRVVQRTSEKRRLRRIAQGTGTARSRAASCHARQLQWPLACQNTPVLSLSTTVRHTMSMLILPVPPRSAVPLPRPCIPLVLHRGTAAPTPSPQGVHRDETSPTGPSRRFSKCEEPRNAARPPETPRAQRTAAAEETERHHAKGPRSPWACCFTGQFSCGGSLPLLAVRGPGSSLAAHHFMGGAAMSGRATEARVAGCQSRPWPGRAASATGLFPRTAEALVLAAVWSPFRGAKSCLVERLR